MDVDETVHAAKAAGIKGASRKLRIPDFYWIQIPEGPFVYQDGETRTLPAYQISRYPVTNMQYQTFIDDDGYEVGRWWQDLKMPQPQASHWPQSNRPRTNVDWYEAVAFTRWLSARLGQPAGTIRLPTEHEWEKAARGTEGLVYPSGNDYQSGFANINETFGDDKVGPWDLEQTTAVGLYPHGRSPYGVEDMVGTVSEWCLNQYDHPEGITIDSSGSSRVLRGGSWLNLSDSARAVSRYRSGPGGRDFIRGFRVVSSVPIVVR